MKTPPFLLLAALLFWGWLSDFLIVGAILGAILEFSRFTKFRWDLDDADFNRIWSFCVVLNVALAGYTFTNNDSGGLNGMLHGSNATLAAVNSSALTVTRFLRWLPMTTFAFIAAQIFNARESVPLTAISLVLRWRRRKGDRAFASRYVNISFPYFIVCIFSAGIHANTGDRVAQFYFWGQAILIAWALWSLRSKRFGISTWFGALLIVLALGYSGMFGINAAQGMIQNFNAQWMARFFSGRTDPLQTMTHMGRIGQMKLSAKIVVWLQPHQVGEAPEYLREASYRNYHPHRMTWYAGGTVTDFAFLRSESDGTTWNFLPQKTNSAGVQISCYLNGWSRELGAPEDLLPLPGGTSRLENVPPNMVLKENKNGAVLAAGRGLLIFDAFYSAGQTIDSPPDLGSTNQFDVFVPTNEIPAIDQAIAEMALPADADYEHKLLAVQKFFLDKFTYSVWQGNEKRAGTNATPLTKFLTTSRSGHCEYFATATVLILRELKIPARYAVGYYVHEPRGSGYVVRERDGHAWCLAWNENKKCWEDFDTTPPSWVSIESKRTEFWQWLSDTASWLKFQFAKFRWRQANLQQYILCSLIPVMLVLLWHILFRRRGKLRAAGKNKIAEVIWPGLDSEFYQLEKKLAARGLPRQNGEPLADWLERALPEKSLSDLRPSLCELLRLHYQYRFDPRGLDASQREELKTKTILAIEKISAATK